MQITTDFLNLSLKLHASIMAEKNDTFVHKCFILCDFDDISL